MPIYAPRILRLSRPHPDLQSRLTKSSVPVFTDLSLMTTVCTITTANQLSYMDHSYSRHANSAGLALPQTHFAHHKIARRDRLRAGEALGEVGCGSQCRLLLLLLSCVLSLSCTTRLSIPLYLLTWNIPPSPAYCLSPDEDSYDSSNLWTAM